MFLLASTSDLIQVVTTTTAETHVLATWADHTTTTLTLGRTGTVIEAATTSTVVPSPASDTQRQVKSLMITNADSVDSNVVTVQHYDGAKTVQVYSITLAPGEMAIWNGTKWRTIDDNGVPVVNQLDDTVDVQLFEANGTWVKPQRGTVVYAEVIGSGGGGGGGSSNTGAVQRMGGGGGGGGACHVVLCLASDLDDTESVTIGLGGAGGAGGTSGNSGSNGTNGTATTFGPFTSYGGGGGLGGQNSATNSGGGSGGGTLSAGLVGSTTDVVGGLPGTGVVNVSGGGGGRGRTTGGDYSSRAEFGGAGGAGRVASSVTTYTFGGTSLLGGGGGGSGAPADATPTLALPTPGGWGGDLGYTAGGGGLAGSNGPIPTAGGAGVPSSCFGGSGGGGGGGTITVNVTGGAGGDGGSPGGGGGGGGIGCNNGSGGAGGDGANGTVRVYTC